MVSSPLKHEPQLLVVVGVERHLGVSHELHISQHNGERPVICGPTYSQGGSVISIFAP